MQHRPGRPHCIRLLALVLGVAGSLMVAGHAVGEAPSSGDARFLAGLRNRGLFELAETYCRDRLRGTQLTDSRRAELVVELSRTLAERAVNLPPDERAPLWREANQAVEDFSQQYPDSPRLPLVRLQAGLANLACGELARRESQVVVDPQALLELAKTQLRQAIRQLEELGQSVEQQLRERSTTGRSGPRATQTDQLTVDQLASLGQHIQYQLARALRNQAECYPADSADRSNSLIRAINMLKPLASLDSDHPLVWRSRLDLIDCYRLVGDYATSQRGIEAVLQAQPPAPVALRVRAQQVQLALAQQRLQEALGLVSQGRELGGAVSPDLDAASLETYLAAWQAALKAKDNAAADRWQTKATETVELIERTHSPYWVRQAQMMLASSVQSSPGTADLALVVRAAENAFRSGQFDEALAAYDRARSIAHEASDPDRAFELGYVAATIEHQRNRHAEALDRYRQTALAVPGHSRASEAHSLAIYHAAQLAKDETPASLDRYAQLLEEHLRSWPSAPDANDVRSRLGRLRQLRADWAGAIAAYREISPDAPQFVAALQALEQCTDAWIAERKKAGESSETAAAAAAGWFESVVLGPQRRLPERWSDAQRQAALAAARIHLTYTPNGHEQAEKILSAALVDARGASPQWQASAQSLLILSLAGQGHYREAANVLQRLASGPLEPLPGILEGLNRLAATAGPQMRVELAQLELRTIDMLQSRRGELNQAQQRTLERCRAQALADAGKTEEALAAYHALAAANPRDGATQEAYAQLLSDQRDPAMLEAALAKWQEIAQKSDTASPRWFRAEYAIASLNYRLGKRDQALKLLKRLKVLYPDLGGAEMKAQILDLLDRCQR